MAFNDFTQWWIGNNFRRTALKANWKLSKFFLWHIGVIERAPARSDTWNGERGSLIPKKQNKRHEPMAGKAGRG